MKTKFLLFIFAFELSMNAIGQNTLELTFSAVENAAFIQLDSIKVINQTQGGDTHKLQVLKPDPQHSTPNTQNLEDAHLVPTPEIP